MDRLCAVIRRPSSVGAIPTRQLSLQPVAIGAAVEVTRLPKPSMQRVPVGDSASRQAVTCSERRAGLETFNVVADPATGWGRPRRWLQSSDTRPSVATGVMATACLYRERERNTGSPSGGGVRQPDAREGQAGPSGVSERLIVPLKPGNAGRGKGPPFKVNARRGQSQEIGDEPNTST